MKVEIELPDLTEYYFPGYSDGDGGYVTNEEIQRRFVAEAIDHFVDTLYDHSYDYSHAINDAIKGMINEHKQEIIETIIDRVADTILKNKAIVEQMPKKSEINAINKEWDKYFIERIDSAIARRFK